MTRTRTHFPFRIDVWTTNGESIVEKVVGWDPVQSPGTLARGYPSRIKLGVPKIYKIQKSRRSEDLLLLCSLKPQTISFSRRRSLWQR